MRAWPRTTAPTWKPCLSGKTCYSTPLWHTFVAYKFMVLSWSWLTRHFQQNCRFNASDPNFVIILQLYYKFFGLISRISIVNFSSSLSFFHPPFPPPTLTPQDEAYGSRRPEGTTRGELDGGPLHPGYPRAGRRTPGMGEEEGGVRPETDSEI